MEQQTARAEPVAPADSKVVIPRWIQLVSLPLLLIVGWIVAIKAGQVMVTFLIGAIVALLLNPIVHAISRRGIPRGIVIAGVYMAFVALMTFLVVVLVNVVADQVRSLAKAFPDLVRSATHDVQNIQTWLDKKGIDIHLIGASDNVLDDIEQGLASRASDIASFTGGFVNQVVDALFHLFIVFITSIYMLIYGPKMADTVRSKLPPIKTREDDFPHLLQRAVSNYVIAQFFLSLIMGAAAGIGLWVFGAVDIFPDGEKYAPLFGVWVFFMEFVPYIGPWLGAAPALLVALITDPISALWIAIFFLVLVELEGHLLAPVIFGKTLRINPLLVIFALLTGMLIYGIIGALLALPVVAMLRAIILYGSSHFVMQPWGAPLTVGGFTGAGSTETVSGIGCPSCGETVRAGKRSCVNCGAELSN